MTAGITKDQPHGIAAQWMIDEIEKRSDGRIKITLYDNNTLGTERECAEGTQTGNFDFSIVNMSVMSNFIPEYGVFDLPYIFDRYYRSRSDAGKQGTGLGLSITKAIFQQHSFRFGVQSTVGKGTTFWFVMSDLPYVDDFEGK